MTQSSEPSQPLPIQGRRTRLSEVTEADAAEVARLRSDPLMNRFLSSQRPTTAAEQAAWIRQNRERRDNYYLKIEDLAGAFHGTISLLEIANGAAEFGRFVCTDPTMAVEAEWLLLDLAFHRLGLERVHCRSADQNKGIWKMHERFGFQTIAVADDPELGRIFTQEITAARYREFDYSGILKILSRIQGEVHDH